MNRDRNQRHLEVNYCREKCCHQVARWFAASRWRSGGACEPEVKNVCCWHLAGKTLYYSTGNDAGSQSVVMSTKQKETGRDTTKRETEQRMGMIPVLNTRVQSPTPVPAIPNSGSSRFSLILSGLSYFHTKMRSSIVWPSEMPQNETNTNMEHSQVARRT